MEKRERGLPRDGEAIRRQVIDTCLWLVEKELVAGTWGNISVRLDDGNILITPSKIPYEEMKPEDMMVIDPFGNIVKGIHLPTSERDIHRNILNMRNDVHAIIHTHSENAMACCAIPGGIPPISEEMAQIIGGGIPICQDFVPSEKHGALGEEVSRCLGDANAILIRNHGPVCLGRDLEEAKLCAQVVEKSAGMYLKIRMPGRINTIEDQWVKAGRRYYTQAYGRT